jgi:hypothetical protein
LEAANITKELSLMAKKSVLAIGLEPALAEPAILRQTSPDLIRSYITSQLERLRKAGYDVESCLIDLGETAEGVVTGVLKAKEFDCVMIGAGLRSPPSPLLLFERILNLVHTLAPGAKICFNSTPADTLEAVQRWI